MPVCRHKFRKCQQRHQRLVYFLGGGAQVWCTLGDLDDPWLPRSHRRWCFTFFLSLGAVGVSKSGRENPHKWKMGKSRHVKKKLQMGEYGRENNFAPMWGCAIGQRAKQCVFINKWWLTKRNVRTAHEVNTKKKSENCPKVDDAEQGMNARHDAHTLLFAVFVLFFPPHDLSCHQSFSVISNSALFTL